ncbi:unnamed protein product [Cladocopium goreaui]|uniref:Uncharacterized protein n=1 Tax=Cladocopium goreaui TaxID=2562237 RepID=A0A9P1G1K9_9DINO|nr:unnamed protein product [Cladocopium goreaui]
MQRWISAINEDAQEQRRRDRYFLPLSVAEEIIAEQRQLTEEEAAESKRQKAAASTIRRELACARIAAALSSTSDCLSTGLLQLRNWVQYQKDQEEAEAAEAAEAARAEYAAAEAEAAAAETQRLEILERFASILCRALQRSMIVGLSHLGVSNRCCYRSVLLCRAIQRGQSARAAARHEALSKTMQMLKMPRTCEANFSAARNCQELPRDSRLSKRYMGVGISGFIFFKCIHIAVDDWIPEVSLCFDLDTCCKCDRRMSRQICMWRHH